MSSSAAYLDHTTAREQFLAEDVGEVELESPDYFDVNVAPVKEYLSKSRSITKITNKKDKNGQPTTVFEITLDGGVDDLESGQTFGNGQYPFRTWLSTTKFEQKGRVGTTSGVAQYLKEAGFDPKTLKTRQDILDAMEATLQTPMKVFIGWKDRGVKQPDGSYKDLNMKTKDFITGQDAAGNPVYSPVLTLDGVQIRATEKVGSFRRFA